MSKITAGVTTPTALTLTGDTTGEITFEVSGTVTAATIDSSGNVGIGGAADARSKLQITGTLPTDATNSLPVVISGTIPSGTTSQAQMFRSNPTTQATSFTLSNLGHFVAGSSAFGAGSTVINQYGFWAASAISNATNNYGFYSDIASGSNRWNFYASGTANNYFAGETGFGGTPSGFPVDVVCNASAFGVRLRGRSADNISVLRFTSNDGSTNYSQFDVRSNVFMFNAVANIPIEFYTNNTVRATLTAAGEFITGGTTDQGAYNLQCNGTGVWGAGAYVNGSDERLKDDIATLNDGLNVVSQLRPVTFKYKPDYSKDQNVQTGFIAQELQAVLAGKDYVDGIVQAGPNHLNVAYQSLIPILVKAIQELTARVAELEDK